MVDADLMTAKLTELARRIQRVRSRAPASAAALAQDEDLLDIVSFNLMLAVQSCGDIASHLIADGGWVPADSAAESFRRLAEHGVIAADLAVTLGRAVGLRNVVAHGYERIDHEIVHRASTTGLADLDRFAREVAAWVLAHP